MVAVDREGGPDCGERMDFDDVVRGSGLFDCGILIYDLNSLFCVKSADRVIEADCLESKDVFEGFKGVETFDGVNCEADLQIMERLGPKRLGGRLELPSFRGHLLSKVTGGEPTVIGAPEGS